MSALESDGSDLHLPQMRPEEELCFFCESHNLSRLEERLWVTMIDGVGNAGRGRIKTFGSKRAVHLFLRGTTEVNKERVRVWREADEVVASVQWKTFSCGQKHESRSEIIRGHDAIASLLRSRGPILAGFAKERLYAIHKFSGNRKLKIGLDRVVPFSIMQNAEPGPEFSHVEFEGNGTGIERDFVTSPFFSSQIAPLVRPLTAADTKWKLAQAMTGRMAVEGCNADWVDNCLSNAEAALRERLGVIRSTLPHPSRDQAR